MTASDRLDIRHMSRALELAGRGLWSTDPNPRVGCVIADGERVLGEGWHERAGSAHAEVNALAEAGAGARGATAYVTLEPCCHQGRTPPCTDALVAAGIHRVFYSIRDPNPRVSGGGAARLVEAGVEVTGGLLATRGRELNPGFLSRMERGRPWLRLKLAASLDGRTALAGGESRWITGEAARSDVQHLRARSSAVMTGLATVVADDPRLDVRLPEAPRQPLRIVLDTRLRIPASARIVAPPGQLLVLTASEEVAQRVRLESAGARVVRVPAGPGGIDLPAVMEALATLEINELQVECGPTLATALLAARLVDELVIYMAPVLLGADAHPLTRLAGITQMAGRMEFSILDLSRVGADMRITLRPAQG
jgi:diaminohydroxyphosphoribosylaminopyrimidine deaminase / 5-amino-6-(5-phosphoribosylamino)uracil reductase